MSGARIEIPIFPLSSVLFPGGRLGLRIFEQRYYDMTKRCIADDAPFGVCLIKGGFEVGTPAVPYDIGCTARIDEWEMPAPTLFNLAGHGESVFRILERRVQADGLIVGTVELREPPTPQTVPPKHAELVAFLVMAIAQVGDDQFPRPRLLDDAAWVGNRLAEILSVTPERKQSLLELGEPLAVLDQLSGWVMERRSAAGSPPAG